MSNMNNTGSITVNYTAGSERATYMTNVAVFSRRTGRRPPLWDAPYYLRARTTPTDALRAAIVLLVPRLPWEVIDQICRHADLQTLLVLCRTSFGLLELSGRLVYETVTLHKVDQLRLLLYQVSCQRAVPQGVYRH